MFGSSAISYFAGAFFVSFAISLVAGLFLIPALRRADMGQTIREDGPVWHNKKQGTPTMGGIIFILGTIAACLSAGIPIMRNGDFIHIFIFLFALIYAGIGLIDDYRKLKKKQNLGLRARQKFFLQLVIAILFVQLMRSSGYLTPSLYVPFANLRIMLPESLYYIIAAFVTVGTVNAVNITDGVDGLATGVTIPVTACFAAIALLLGRVSVGLFAASLTGGLAAFLVFNFHPAKVFMGDTGSHFIGGAVCALAFACDMPLILILLGFVYVVETLSDIIQVTYFKLTKGKRIFKMAPIHHHFEMIGWSEYKLFAVFTSVSAVFAAIAYLGIRNL